MERLRQTELDAAGVYALFASVLAFEPDARQVEHMRLLLGAAGIDIPDCLAEGDKLTRLFHDRMVVVVSPLFVPAVESCMADAREGEGGRIEPGHVDGKRMTEVLACYRTYGFDPGSLNGFGPLVNSMRPDHLVAELAFMAHLRRVQAAGGVRGGAAGAFADEFLERHLRCWVPTLCAFAGQRGGTDAYVRLFEAVRRWTELDAG